MKIFIIFVTTFFCSYALASDIQQTQVTKMMLSKNYGNKVYIQTSVAHHASEPSCHNSNWSYVLQIDNDVDKNMYSMLLAAQMAGKKLDLVGTHNCNSHVGIEGLQRIELLN